MSEPTDNPEQAANVQSESRSIDVWLREYSQYHENRINKLIHWVCVPLIMVSLLGLLWIIPLPNSIAGTSDWANPAMLLFVVAIIFYLRLSIPLTIGMAVIAGAALWGIHRLEARNPAMVWQLSVGVFVIAWIGQFIGHKIEGRKPAFFKDIQFLLIGPIWLLGFVYQRLGIRY